LDPDGPVLKETATMRSTVRVRKALALAAGLALLSLWTAPARADDENLNINKRGTDEKKFMVSLAKAIIKAAHPTAKDAALEKGGELKKGKEEGRATIPMTIVYYGALTKTKYTAEVEVKLDTSKPNEWKVLEIDYRDDNTKLKFSKTNIEKLQHKLNGQS
jgi:hypothetical protein